MLTATEKARVQKFTAEMDGETSFAMHSLFEITKPGCDNHAYELFDAAHTGQKVSAGSVSKYESYGIVRPNGDVPKPVRSAIKRAIAQKFLEMRGPTKPELKCELRYLDYG